MRDPIPHLEPRIPDPDLKLLSAQFVTSAAAGGRTDGIPRDGLGQIAVAGRSNVGKSSLLNALCRRSIARTSAAPGKTRLANVYRVTLEGGGGTGPGRWGVYLVDLPGYGYARGGADSATELAAVADAYFASGDSGLGTRDSKDRRRFPDPEDRIPNPGVERAKRATLLLIDSRHPALDADIAAARWLDAVGAARHLVATKIDKLSRVERTRNLREIERVFGTAALPVSATNGEGLDDLWRLIARVARARENTR